MRANLDGDLINGRGALIEGPEITPELVDVPVERLRFVNGVLIDAANLSIFYVDADGRKHAVNADPSWQQVICSWDAPLIWTGSVWRARTSVDDLLAYAAAKRWKVEVGGVSATVAGDVVIVSTDRGDDRIALLGEHSALVANIRADGGTFKFADGISREVSNAEMAAIVQAAFAHVQAAFNVERAVSEAIRSTPPTVTTTEQIDAEFSVVV